MSSWHFDLRWLVACGVAFVSACEDEQEPRELHLNPEDDRDYEWVGFFDFEEDDTATPRDLKVAEKVDEDTAIDESTISESPLAFAEPSGLEPILKPIMTRVPYAAFGSIYEGRFGVHFDIIDVNAPIEYDGAILKVYGIRLPLDNTWREDGFDATVREVGEMEKFEDPTYTPLGKSYLYLRRSGKEGDPTISRELDLKLSGLNFRRLDSRHFEVWMDFDRHPESEALYKVDGRLSFSAKMEIVRN